MRKFPRARTEEKYEALSYSWHENVVQVQEDGSSSIDDSSQYLICNGVKVSAQPNLILAMRYLRHHSSLLTPSNMGGRSLHQPERSAGKEQPGTDHGWHLKQSNKDPDLAWSGRAELLNTCLKGHGVVVPACQALG